MTQIGGRQTFKDRLKQILSLSTRSTILRTGLRRASRAGLVPRYLWSRWPVHGQFEIALPAGDSFQYHAVPGDAVGSLLFWGGCHGFDGESLSVFTTMARRARTFLDVGANTGPYSLIACATNPQIRVVAFEPVPHIRENLCRNVEINGWSQRIQIVGEALAEAPGTATFHVQHGNVPTSSSLVDGGFRGTPSTPIEVKLSTVDQWGGKTGQIDLMKIDVEGAEDRVFAGMRRTLLQDRPTIIVECLPDGPIAKVEAVLRAAGYRFFHLTAEGPQERGGIMPDAREVFRNYLCVVREADLQTIGASLKAVA